MDMVDKKELKRKYKLIVRELKKLEKQKKLMLKEKESTNNELNALFQTNSNLFQDLLDLIQNNRKDDSVVLINKVNQLDKNDQKFGILYSVIEAKDKELSTMNEKITKLKELKAQILGHLEYDDNLFDDLMKELTKTPELMLGNIKSSKILKKGLYRLE